MPESSRRESENEPEKAPWEILDIEAGATKEDIDKAFKTKIKGLKDAGEREAVSRAWAEMSEGAMAGESGGEKHKRYADALKGVSKTTKAEKEKRPDSGKSLKVVGSLVLGAAVAYGAFAELTRRKEEGKPEAKPSASPVEHKGERKPIVKPPKARVIEEEPDAEADEPEAPIVAEEEPASPEAVTEAVPEAVTEEKENTPVPMDEKEEKEAVSNFEFFIKGAKVQSDGFGGFVIDARKGDIKDRKCYLVTPEYYPELQKVQNKYLEGLNDIERNRIASESKVKGFNRSGKIAGVRENAKEARIKLKHETGKEVLGVLNVDCVFPEEKIDSAFERAEEMHKLAKELRGPGTIVDYEK